MEIKVVENENEIYVRERLLGQGAFGKAYLVKHISSGEQLVIKEMNIEHMTSKEKEETIKEAQILRNLSHPNIVNFKEVYITKNKLKIVMEYAECGDLAKAVSARKAKKEYFQEVQILNWFTQIYLAIKHVHDRKILHRDIKGQNIFITWRLWYSKKISLLPDIPLAQEIKFRDDDVFELSLTADLAKEEEEETDLDSEGVDLEYFSNYSKLETLRMQLEETFGLDNFIRLYRLIEKEVNEKGLNGFNMANIIKEIGNEIDSKLVSKNTTPLLTLVALEDNMSYN